VDIIECLSAKSNTTMTSKDKDLILLWNECRGVISSWRRGTYLGFSVFWLAFEWFLIFRLDPCKFLFCKKLAEFAKFRKFLDAKKIQIYG